MMTRKLSLIVLAGFAPAALGDVQWTLTGPTEVLQGRPVQWSAAVTTTEDSQGLAGYTFTLAIGPGSGPTAGPDGAWGTPDDENLAVATLEPAVFAPSFQVGGGSLASVQDPAAAGGPGLNILPSAGSPDVMPGELQQVGASCLDWNPAEQVEGVGLDSRKPVLLADSQGPYLLHTGEIPTSGLAPGDYTVVLIPLRTRVLRSDLDLGQAQPGFIATSATAGGDSFTFTITVPQIFGDFDGDGDVDDADFDVFAACATLPEVPYDAENLPQPPPGCPLVPDAEGRIASDFDLDGDTDQTDFARFQACISGSEPADPNCADF